MKLAEALQERADLNRNIEQLKSRIKQNVLCQEGEDTAEDISVLKQELDASLDRLAWLIFRINVTNSSTIVEGKSLTEMIAAKDMLTLKIHSYKDVTNMAGNRIYRIRGSEIKIHSSISVPEWQKDIDRMSGELRKIDNLLQQTNWNTNLLM